MPQGSSWDVPSLIATSGKLAWFHHRHLPGSTKQTWQNSGSTLLWSEVHTVSGKDEVGKTRQAPLVRTQGASLQKFQFQSATRELSLTRTRLFCMKSYIQAPTHWLVIGKALRFNLTFYHTLSQAGSAAVCCFWWVKYGWPPSFWAWEM